MHSNYSVIFASTVHVCFTALQLTCDLLILLPLRVLSLRNIGCLPTHSCMQKTKRDSWLQASSGSATKLWGIFVTQCGECNGSIHPLFPYANRWLNSSTPAG